MIFPSTIDKDTSQIITAEEVGAKSTYGPWRYHHLPLPDAVEALRELANPVIEEVEDVQIHSLTVQPNVGRVSEDRYSIRKWVIKGETWLGCFVFDGHLGSQLVQSAIDEIPVAVEDSLTTYLSTRSPDQQDEAAIGALLKKVIVDFDAKIEKDLRALFPLEELATLTKEQIVERITASETNKNIVDRAMSGSMLACGVLNVEKRQLWIATVGDCEALIGTKKETKWEAELVCPLDDEWNEAEHDRVRKEHPGEEDVVIALDTRPWILLSSLAVTRVLGNMTFKVEVPYVSQVFSAAAADGKWFEKLVPKLKTPPYASSEPHISYRQLTRENRGGQFLLLMSDGVRAGFNSKNTDFDTVTTAFAGLVGRQIDSWNGNGDGEDVYHIETVEKSFGTIQKKYFADKEEKNVAFSLLKNHFGGQEEKLFSAKLAYYDMEGKYDTNKWMDDTTIVAVLF
ncbi:hypothetical protein BT69DRAFT_1349175 [Atractiella rhizophila]|nr:hypothetical protein BT69DRAFT_1349175 [Atractiella rhizophila]